MAVGVAVDLLVAILIAGFGAWRVAAGLSYLGVIRRRVPGRDLQKIGVPRIMQAGEGVSGWVDLFGGGLALFFAVVLVADAFS